MTTAGAVLLRGGTTAPTATGLGADDLLLYVRSGATYYKGSDGVEHAFVGVLATRTINTTAPLTGGGDLSADRTLALTTSPTGQTPVGVTRLLNTTAPITGGGDLSADRTLALTTSPTGQTPVGVTRLINTTSPLTGGGALSADLTVAIPAATTTTAGHMTAAQAKVVNDVFIDVRNFGVDPANTATANRTALLALFASAASGSTLFFPGGTYQFDQNMNVGAKTFTFAGQGSQLTGGFTILEIVTGTAGLLTLTSGNWYTTFKNLIFAAGTTQTSGSMVTVNDNVAVNFTDCSFANLGGTQFNCIDYTGTTASANTTVIDRCFMAGFTNVGINVASNGASLVVNNTIIQGQWGSTSQLAAAGIQVGEAGALQVDNCDIIGCVNNMLLNPVGGKVVASVYVTNTYMDFSGGSCLKISGAGATVRCRFISVSFTTASSFTGTSAVEISTTVTAGAQGIDFENCSMLNTFSTTGTTNGMLITGAADFTVDACRIAGYTNGINLTPFNSAGKTQPVIENNTIGATGGIAGNSVGILLNAGAVTYGDTLIQNNILSGNTSAPMTDNSTHTTTAFKLISGNAGWMGGAGDLQALSSGGAARIATRGAATSGTTETFLFTFRIPANAVSVGQKFLIRIEGQHSSTGTSICTIKSGATGTIGSDTIVSATAASAAAVANQYLSFEGMVTVVALGPTATVAASGYVVSNAAVVQKAAAAEALANTPTTAAWFITVSWTTTVAAFTVKHATCVAL